MDEMSMIAIRDLSFAYGGGLDAIFTHVDLQLDTDWRLGLIGRNGRGKTTLLRLLMGELPHEGSIHANVGFTYFPFAVADPQRDTLCVLRESIAPFDAMEREMEQCLAALGEETTERYFELLERYQFHDGYQIDGRIEAELSQMGMSTELLGRPFSTLSNGEQTRALLCALFLRRDRFVLLDEPTNHLDERGRELTAQYLGRKKGFIVVSHDRSFLDQVVDHILSIDKCGITLEQGNYSSWRENERRREQQAHMQLERARAERERLELAARRAADWAGKTEQGKFAARNAGLRPDRGFVGHRAAKLMKRAKSIESRREEAAAQKAELIRQLESAEPIVLKPLPPEREKLVTAADLTIRYAQRSLFEKLRFSIGRGDRVALTGPNGCGKSSVIKLVMGEPVPHEGTLWRQPGLIVSYVPQDTSFLRGSLRDFTTAQPVNEAVFRSILRKLGFSRAQFDEPMESYSAGQRKKVLLAASLASQAHLYIWDEPLNYIDIVSREQIEQLLLQYRPSMLFVEHDRAFVDNVATEIIRLGRQEGEDR
ncbi:ribosomal protection-like ABC-F family protein [Feifania hominis]|uniref:ribosomal protection-like ABC-F family protein n=1 Tax=Feifania hominis TaxID=2763660 RepID=UPI0020161BEC